MLLELPTMPDVAYKSFRTKRAFGVELEVSNTFSGDKIRDLISSHSKRNIQLCSWAQSFNNNYWHIKKDSTCGPNAHRTKDYGWEVASYKANGYKDVLHIAKIAEILKNAGVKTNRNCGFHIHAEVNDFNIKQAMILLALWIKIEPVMCFIVPGHRVNQKHCKLWSKNKKYKVSYAYSPEEFWKIARPRDLGPHNNSYRKVSLNLVNFAYAVNCEGYGGGGGNYRKTIELRLPEGTLDRENVVNWIRLFLNFVDASKKSKMPKNLKTVKNISEFLQILGLEGTKEFYMLSQGLSNTKRWALDRILNNENTSPKFVKQAKEKIAQMTDK